MKLRWVLKCNNLNLSLEQFSTALSALQDEEKKRICAFVFKKDFNTALIGRLMIRKAVMLITGLNNNQIKLHRTQNGKPFLPKLDENLEKVPQFDFNISHDKDIVILASDASHVGTDVMNIARPYGCGTLIKFFELMTRQFHKKEWEYIKFPSSEHLQLQRFYRLWCIKESYVKALGVGIHMKLDTIQCCVQDDLFDDTKNPKERRTVTSSYIKVDEQEDTNYKFEESLLFGQYIACVAVNNPQNNERSEPFKLLTFEDLMEKMAKSEEPGVVNSYNDDYVEYCNRPYEPMLNKT